MRFKHFINWLLVYNLRPLMFSFFFLYIFLHFSFFTCFSPFFFFISFSLFFISFSPFLSFFAGSGNLLFPCSQHVCLMQHGPGIQSVYNMYCTRSSTIYSIHTKGIARFSVLLAKTWVLQLETLQLSTDTTSPRHLPAKRHHFTQTPPS